MINELPVVGKRYKGLNSGLTYESLLVKENKILLESKPHILWFDFDTFWDYFEELPDSNPQEVSEVDRALEELKIELSPSKAIPVFESRATRFCYFNLEVLARNLVNALEAKDSEIRPKSQSHVSELDMKVKQDMSKLEPKIDMKEERVEPVSIWKDVSELPYNYAKVILKIKAGTNYYLGAFFKDGEFYDEELSDFENLPIRKEAIWKWCFKNDPLKTLEQIQKDIEELKRK